MAQPTRRAFLGGVAGAAATLGLPRTGEDAPPLRALGATGRELPALGLGCFPVGAMGDGDAAIALVRRVIDDGVRYLDTAPSYAKGTSERRVGKAIADCGVPREELFVATKTLEREGDAALVELEESLARLGLDYVDSIQVHEVRSEEDAAGLTAEGGVCAALASAREAGKVRHIGVTGHRDPRWVARALGEFDFATALVPVNPLDTQHRSFTRDLLPLARRKGVAVIAMKVLAGGHLPQARPEVAVGDLVRYALAQPGVCVAVPGVDRVEHWEPVLAGALGKTPEADELTALEAAVGPHAGKDSEWYKDA